MAPPLEYEMDITSGTDRFSVEAAKNQVRAHLVSLSNDPLARPADVRVWISRHPTDEKLLKVSGYLPSKE